jgi:hypothetical protein
MDHSPPIDPYQSIQRAPLRGCRMGREGAQNELVEVNYQYGGDVMDGPGARATPSQGVSFVVVGVVDGTVVGW